MHAATHEQPSPVCGSSGGGYADDGPPQEMPRDLLDDREGPARDSGSRHGAPR
jgi:hypothetical protein